MEIAVATGRVGLLFPGPNAILTGPTFEPGLALHGESPRAPSGGLLNAG